MTIVQFHWHHGLGIYNSTVVGRTHRRVRDICNNRTDNFICGPGICKDIGNTLVKENHLSLKKILTYRQLAAGFKVRNGTDSKRRLTKD